MCGANKKQQAIGQSQTDLFKTMAAQGQQVFGNSSTVFNDLLNSYAPIVAAGPNQEGFSAPEKAALDSQAITNTGNDYRNASTAVKESESAVGGGNVALPGGARIGTDLSIADSAAAQTSGELNEINQADYATGRQNFFTAASGLAGSTNVFNPATSLEGATVNAGSAAANTENEIASQDNSWMSAVAGGLGKIAGSAVTGGFDNLGNGVGFFGQNAPAPGTA